ncbi:MAG: AIR synthase-related protein, partial [Promethearchaeota archaeon]
SIQTDLNIKDIEKVEVIKVYTLEGGNLSEDELKFLGKEVFSDPIVEVFSIDKPLAGNFKGAIVEIGYKPGVTDNVGRTSKEAVKDAINKELNGAYFSQQYLFYGLNEEEAERVAAELLANKLIQTWRIADGTKYQGFEASIPKVILKNEPKAEEINLNVSDEELLKINNERVLALNLEELHAIRDFYNEHKEERLSMGLPANPTDIELECLAQTWSEHCKHKIFNAEIEYEEYEYVNGGAGNKEERLVKKETINSLFNTYIKRATEEINSDYLVSVFKDNAGVIKLNDDYIVSMKVETHNSPTALDPYGGALTGIVGCNRDPAGTGKGFKLIFNTDVFCFASPFYGGKIPPRLFHPRRVMKGVHKGIIDGGNQSGIPTVNGSLYFDKRFLGKPLVFCGTGGIAPAKIKGKGTHEKGALVGDLAIMVGGRIGADGIHGATFSSLEINENSPATAVQIGAPIVQKKMLDFLLEARDRDLIHAITDNGAGGLSSSFGEMGEDVGVRLDLEKPPLKYSGLMPWEILVSEAQERMSIAIDPKNLDELMELARLHDVEATVIGKFDGSKTFSFYYNGKLIGAIPMQFLHHGVPQKHMKGIWRPVHHEEPDIIEPTDHNALIKRMLGRLNICSKEEPIVREYDHEVQGTSIIKPFMGDEKDGPSDAAVIKPLYDSWEGLVISHGLCPRYSDIDTYAMAANAIDEAVRNAVCVGADPEYLSGLDNFCWAMGFSKEDEIKYTGDLVRANKALYDVCITYKVPCISGKDSMKNDYRIGDNKVSVPPTLMYSIMGKIHDVRKAITMDAKRAGDLVYVLGTTKNELGCSEYFDELGFIGNKVPRLEPKKAIDRYKRLHKAINMGIVASAHDCSDGGLAIALAETAFAGNLGMKIDLRKVPNTDVHRDDFLLYSETPARIIVTVEPQYKEQFEEIFKNTEFGLIGNVQEDLFTVIGLKGDVIINAHYRELKQSWKQTLSIFAKKE